MGWGFLTAKQAKKDSDFTLETEASEGADAHGHGGWEGGKGGAVLPRIARMAPLTPNLSQPHKKA